MTAQKTLLSGMTPTNRLTLGNYIGALRNWVKLQREYDCFFMVADLHGITTRQDPKLLRDNTRTVAACYLAAGIDPDACALFVQSHVSQHAELAWVLTCHSYMGEMNRMTQFKDKSGKEGQNIPTGLFVYPALMAADILLYQAHLVPVGADQKQHLELTRDVAERMNNLYKDKLFIVPNPYIAPVGARIMDLQDPESKMSKSGDQPMGAIYLIDTDSEIEKKFKRAVTDSGSEIKYSSEKAGVSNLLEIQSALTGLSHADLESKYVGKQYGHLKIETAQIVQSALKPVREKIQEYLADPAEMDRLLKKGAEKARVRAAQTLKKVYERVGFLA